MANELLPVGQLTNKKRLVETSSSGTVAELVASWAQASTEVMGLLGTSTEVIGHVIADLSTAIVGYVKIDQTTPGTSNAVTVASTSGGILLSTALPGKVQALASTSVIGHVIADASTAKIGALQGSTESIGYITANASTEKIGALQTSTEIIGYVKIDQTTPGTSNAVTLVSTGGATQKWDGQGNAIVTLRDPNNNHYTAIYGPDSDAKNAGNGYALPVNSINYLLGSTNDSWDRQRGNYSAVVLASTSRTSTATSADQTNYNARAHILYVAYDTATGAGLTPSVQVKDSVSGLYGTVWTGTAITSGSTGLYTYLLGPSVTTAASTGYTQASQVHLGRTWRLVVNPSSSGATQYSASVDNLM